MTTSQPAQKNPSRVLAIVLIICLLIIVSVVACVVGGLSNSDIEARKPEALAIVDALGDHAAQHWEAHCQFPPTLRPTATREQICDLKSYTPTITDPRATGSNPKFDGPLYFIYETTITTYPNVMDSYLITARLNPGCTESGYAQVSLLVSGTKDLSGKCTASKGELSTHFMPKYLMYFSKLFGVD